MKLNTLADGQHITAEWSREVQPEEKAEREMRLSLSNNQGAREHSAPPS